jgi:hypothetical protein
VGFVFLAPTTAWAAVVLVPLEAADPDRGVVDDRLRQDKNTGLAISALAISVAAVQVLVGGAGADTATFLVQAGFLVGFAWP